MRIGLPIACGLLWLVLGTTCLPLVDETKRSATPGTSLAIAVVSPTQAATVSAGQRVKIEWAAANLTGEAATVSIVVESRTDLSLTTLLADTPLEGTGGSGEFIWNTTGFSGAYSIIATVQTADSSAQGKSAAFVTVTATSG